MLLKSKFERSLRSHARRLTTRFFPHRSVAETTQTIADVELDQFGFAKSDPTWLGHLTALILCQAQCDGASRVRLHYCSCKMFYTLDGVDYEMVPPPQPILTDLVRQLACAANVKRHSAGTMIVRFSDRALAFTLRHDGEIDDRYLEITGFTGERLVASVATGSRA